MSKGKEFDTVFAEFDLPGMRLGLVQKVPNAHFTERDEKLLACCVLAYAKNRLGAASRRRLGFQPPMEMGEAAYLLETFGYEVYVLGLTKRQFLMGLLPHYSLAGQHPELVHLIFRMFLEPAVQEWLLSLPFHLPMAADE